MILCLLRKKLLAVNHVVNHPKNMLSVSKQLVKFYNEYDK